MDNLRQEQTNIDLVDEIIRQKKELDSKNVIIDILLNEIKRQKKELDSKNEVKEIEAKEIFLKNMFNIDKSDSGEYTLTLSADNRDYFYELMELLNGKTHFLFRISEEVIDEYRNRDK